MILLAWIAHPPKNKKPTTLIMHSTSKVYQSTIKSRSANKNNCIFLKDPGSCAFLYMSPEDQMLFQWTPVPLEQKTNLKTGLLKQQTIPLFNMYYKYMRRAGL